MYRSSSVYSKPKDYLRFTYSIVILLWFYHSSFCALGGGSLWYSSYKYIYIFFLLLLFSVFCWRFVLTLLYDGAWCCDMATGIWCLSVGLSLG
jgi:hypothetical protein